MPSFDQSTSNRTSSAVAPNPLKADSTALHTPSSVSSVYLSSASAQYVTKQSVESS